MANSGAEANEAALKLARIQGSKESMKLFPSPVRFMAGRLQLLRQPGNPSFTRDLNPCPRGLFMPNSVIPALLETLIGEHTCAILCEPFQGESGVRPLDPDYLQAIRQLCDKHGLLLIFDEVQTGMGRTGSLFAYEQLGVTPDIMTVAKALGNGLPIGAMLTTEEHCRFTWGGNPCLNLWR